VFANGSCAAIGCGGRTGDLFAQDAGVPAGGSGEFASGGYAPAGGGGATSSSGGHVGSGGRVGTGGTLGMGEPCSGVLCPEIDCRPNGHATVLPGQCCPVCMMSDPCAGVPCGVISCPPGSTATTSPGQCCPSCTPIADAGVSTCDRAGFTLYVGKQVAALDALSCAIESDCTIVSLSSACEFDCGTAMNAKSARAVFGAAEVFASTACAGCPPTVGGSCTPAHASCVQGECTLIE
jgi:hypothetical protein